MYSKIRTLSDQLSLVRTTINLPKDAVIDALVLRANITIANTSGAPVTLTGIQMLEAISEMRVISDGSTVHYSLNGKDIAVLNGFDGLYGASPVALDSITFNAAPPGDVQTYVATLILNEGDILAVTKDSLELKATFNTAPAIWGAGMACTALTVTASVSENVYTPEEFVAKYGANLEGTAEPKVYALSQTVAANTELTGILDLPTGTLHRRGIMIFHDAAGVYGGTVATPVLPQNVGLIVTSPDRRELLNVDWTTLRGIAAFKYCVNAASPAGCAVFNYAAEVTNDVYGLRGWRWSKGDYQIAVRTVNAATLRYICCEHVVNARVFEAAERAVVEGTAGF